MIEKPGNVDTWHFALIPSTSKDRSGMLHCHDVILVSFAAASSSKTPWPISSYFSEGTDIASTGIFPGPDLKRSMTRELPQYLMSAGLPSAPRASYTRGVKNTMQKMAACEISW